MSRLTENLKRLEEMGKLNRYHMGIIEDSLKEYKKEVRNKSIDEFAERLEELFKYESAWGKTEYHQRLVIGISEIYRIAEEMRGTT